MSDEFALEQTLPNGEIPQRVIDELCRARTTAKDYARAFSDACDAQAKKHGLKSSALKKYICAIEADTLEELDAEAEAIIALTAAHE